MKYLTDHMKFLKNEGYTIINTKNKNYVDGCVDSNSGYYEIFDSCADAKGVLNDIDWCIQNTNNIRSRKLKRNRKYIKVVKLITYYEPVWETTE